MREFDARFLWSARRFVPRLFLAAVIVGIGAARPAHALPTQIASFLENDSNGFQWTNNGNTSATFNTANNGLTLPQLAGVPVTFFFQNLTGVPQGPQFAHAILTSSTQQDGFTAAGQVNQPITGPITLEILRDSDHANLLTASASPNTAMALISGQNGSASLNTSTPGENVTFTSDFHSFSSATLGAFGLTLSGIHDPNGVTSPLSFNTANNRNILNTFVASAIGSFSADVVPEPTSVALMGISCLIVLGARRRLGHKAA